MEGGDFAFFTPVILEEGWARRLIQYFRSAQDFQSIVHRDSCIHALLPPPRDPDLVRRLRHARTFPALTSGTKKYRSFLMDCYTISEMLSVSLYFILYAPLFSVIRFTVRLSLLLRICIHQANMVDNKQ